MFKTHTEVDLSPEWVDSILITAFDGQYGGSNYWVIEYIQEDDLLSWTPIVTTQHTAPCLSAPLPITDEDRSDCRCKLWTAVEWTFRHDFDFSDFRREILGPTMHQVRLDKKGLDYAWARIVNERLIREDLLQQLLRSQHELDIDVDADAADCLAQIALFDQLVYS